MPRRFIDTETFSKKLRERAVDTTRKKLLVTNFLGSRQENDLSVPPNCRGLGRIRHFRRSTSPGWPPNPLPIDPAAKALGTPPNAETVTAQAFQLGACNWRCWYCFVDFTLLSADGRRGEFLTTDELVELYTAETDRPKVIDITGGQPDLVPEWVPWMMQSLERAGLAETTFLWSDDNLSNDYFWRLLTPAEISRVQAYRNYAKVCCFKGFDEESFSFNTYAPPEEFDRQFSLLARYVELGIDVYCYVIFTTPNNQDIQTKVESFVNRLQDIHPNLPRRLVPLEVQEYTPVRSRNLSEMHERALSIQNQVVVAWQENLDRRFTSDELKQNIAHVSM